PGDHPQPRRDRLRRLGALRRGGAGRGHPQGDRLREQELPGGAACGGHRGALRGARRRHHRRGEGAGRQARTGHVRRGGRRARRAGRARRGVRGRGGGGRRGPRRRLRVGRRGGPHRPRRGPSRARCGHRGRGPVEAAGGVVIEEGVLSVEPWRVTELGLQLDLLPQTESIFALSNGHVGVRGNLDEGEPHATPGTYLNGFFESVPLPYAEAGYGYPETGQSLIDVTDGKLMRLLVDDEPFDVRYGTVEHHERSLDLRDGVLRREVRWTSPAGQGVVIRTTRLVSFVQRAILAIRYEVEPVGEPARIVLQSVLSANQPTVEQRGDPRAAAALRAPLVGEYHTNHGLEAALGHRTRRSGLRMAVSMDHVVEGPDDTVIDSESEA